MTEDERFYQSAFAKWCDQQHAASEGAWDSALTREALEVLAQSIADGEILTLDSTDSPLSNRLSAQFGSAVFEMNSHWVGTAQGWQCPCCNRSKFQIARLGKKQQILAKLVIHHDHMEEVLKKEFYAAFTREGTAEAQVEGKLLIERIGKAFAAYEEVLICEDCNNADTEAKKLVSAPAPFSFSVGQIRRFISSSEHRPHAVNPQRARQVWEGARPAYELRMELVKRVATAASTSAHWYEPHPPGSKAIPLFGNRNLISDNRIRRWIPTERLHRTLAPKQDDSPRNLSRWRNQPPPQVNALPQNFLAVLFSAQHQRDAWHRLSDDWRCPICNRSKEQIIYLGDKGEVCFSLHDTRRVGNWASANPICNHCGNTLMNLKREVSDRIGNTPESSYDFVHPSELRPIIKARPHAAHTIDAAAAKTLLEDIVDRLLFSD